MVNLDTMYPVVVGNRAVILYRQFTAGTDTTISLDSTDVCAIPLAPNMVTLHHETETEQHICTVRYTGITDNTLTGVTVVEGDIPESKTFTFPVGTRVYRPFTKADMDAIVNNINLLNTEKVEFSNQTASKDLKLGEDAYGLYIDSNA